MGNLTIDLSRLKPLELQRLLNVAEARNDRELVRELRQELQQRNLRPDPNAGWSDDDDHRMTPPTPTPVDAPPRPRRTVALGLAGIAVLGLGLVGGLVLGGRRDAPAQAPVPPQQRADVALAVYRPPEAPDVATPPAPTAEPAAASPAADEPAAAAPRRAPAARPATARPAPVRLASTSAGPKRTNPCLDLPTPGERLVCGYPSLAIADRDMQAAYDRAIAAGADPRALDQGQTAFRRDRDRTWDRDQLADRYAQRIQELEVAARPPPPPAPPTSRQEPPF